MLYVNQQKLEHIIKLQEHDEVVNTIVKCANEDLFTVLSGPMWTAIVPRELTEPVPALCVHTDTVFTFQPTQLLKNGPVWTNANPFMGMGADDRAGCYIVKELVTRGYNFIYLIFDQEERGGIGSSAFLETDAMKDLYDYISCFLGLDRMGLNQMACYGNENEEFIEILRNEDWTFDMGSFTDASNLADGTGLCCINFSVGYNNEHTRYETLNIAYLQVTLNHIASQLPDSLWGQQFFADKNYVETLYDDDYYGFGYSRADHEYYYDDELQAWVKYSDESPVTRKTAEKSEAETPFEESEYLTKGA